jgi:hypothetical protein
MKTFLKSHCFFKAQILCKGHKIWEKIAHFFLQTSNQSGRIFQICVAFSEYLNFMIYRVSHGKMTMSYPGPRPIQGGCTLAFPALFCQYLWQLTRLAWKEKYVNASYMLFGAIYMGRNQNSINTIAWIITPPLCIHHAPAPIGCSLMIFSSTNSGFRVLWIQCHRKQN